MFTESVRVSCSFLACCGGSANQTYLIFHCPLMTLDPDCGSVHLETKLTCPSHLQTCPNHFQTCPYHFQSCPIMKPAFLCHLSLVLLIYSPFPV